MFIAVGFLHDAIGTAWKELTPAQEIRLQNFLWSEIHMKLTGSDGVMTYDDMLNCIRDAYQYATKITIVIKE